MAAVGRGGGRLERAGRPISSLLIYIIFLGCVSSDVLLYLWTSCCMKSTDTRARSCYYDYFTRGSFDVVQGRLRSGSVPPRPLRAGSQPPGTRSGSVTPSGRAGSAVPQHAGPGGIIKHRAATTTVVRGVRGDGTTGVVYGPPRSNQRRRASISVVPGTSAAAARRTTDQHQPIVRID